MAAKQQELDRLQGELRRQAEQYTRLLDTKVIHIFLLDLLCPLLPQVALDREIAVFRRLLETEEDRLGLEATSDL